MFKINEFLSNFNLRIEKISTNQNLYDVLNFLFLKLDIDTLFDIGANEGQFAKKIRSAGYSKKIISFEPINGIHQKLKKNSKKDQNWLAENFAIGEKDGDAVINVSNYSLSSSILQMSKIHLDAKESSKYISSQNVAIKKIDTYIKEKNYDNNNLFLKIDTQGTEYDIIKGAQNNIQNIRGILCELSLSELYLGQKLWLEIIEDLTSKNFEIWYLEKGFQHPRNKKVLQLDCVFLNQKFIDKVKN
tara:strand:- start:1828 stop:2562 length:735 start_codon:yes stop_codon:yes gene_type:complete